MNFLQYDSNGKLKKDTIVNTQGRTYMIPSGSSKLVYTENFSQSHQPIADTGSVTLTAISAYDSFEIRHPFSTASFRATPIPSSYITSSITGAEGDIIPINKITNVCIVIGTG